MEGGLNSAPDTFEYVEERSTEQLTLKTELLKFDRNTSRYSVHLSFLTGATLAKCNLKFGPLVHAKCPTGKRKKQYCKSS